MRTTLVAYIRLPHFVPIVAVLAATAGLAWIVAGDELTGRGLARLLLAMLGGQIAVGVVNELVDAPVDALTKPDKPIPAGQVSRRGAVLLGVAGLVLMIVAGATFGRVSLALLILGTGIGVAYSLWFKTTPLAWLPYLAALPLLPIWVAVTFDDFEPGLLTLYLLGAPGVLAIQLAQALPDVAADRSAGFETLTTRLGERRALLLCWEALIGSILVAGLMAGASGVDRPLLAIAAAIGFGAVATNMLIYRRSARSGVLASFPCTVLAVAVLALAWVGGVTS